MNQHRQLRKAKLVDYLERKEKIRIKSLGLCRMIIPLIDPELSEVETMDIPGAASTMDDLMVMQGELLVLSGKIKRLEEALYS